MSNKITLADMMEEITERSKALNSSLSFFYWEQDNKWEVRITFYLASVGIGITYQDAVRDLYEKL